TESNAAVQGDPLAQCSFASNFVSGYCSQVTVNEYDPAQGQLSNDAHDFYGGVSRYQSLFPWAGSLGGWYSWWLEGREFRTDAIQPSTSVTLREKLQTWQERLVTRLGATDASSRPHA